LQPPLQSLDGALLSFLSLGVACRPQPGLGRHMADDRAGPRPLGPLAAADQDVVAKLNESAVPTLLARTNHSRRLGVPRPAFGDLRMDVARQRPGALNGPSVGDRLLTDGLGALQDGVPQRLAADLLRHERQSTADVLRGWTPESHRHPHA